MIATRTTPKKCAGSVRADRKPLGSLSTALIVAKGTVLEPAAKKIVDDLVIEHVTNAAIARALGCVERTVRRLVVLYGWPNGDQRAALRRQAAKRKAGR